MRTRKKPEQLFHDGRRKIIWRRFLAKLRRFVIEDNVVKNPEFD